MDLALNLVFWCVPIKISAVWQTSSIKKKFFLINSSDAKEEGTTTQRNNMKRNSTISLSSLLNSLTTAASGSLQQQKKQQVNALFRQTILKMQQAATVRRGYMNIDHMARPYNNNNRFVYSSNNLLQRYYSYSAASNKPTPAQEKDNSEKTTATEHVRLNVGVVFAKSKIAKLTPAIQSNMDTLVKDLTAAGYTVKFHTLLSGPASSPSDAAAIQQDQEETEDLWNRADSIDAVVVCPLTGGTEQTLSRITELRKPTLLYGFSSGNSLAAAVELREFYRNHYIPTKLVTNVKDAQSTLDSYANNMDVLQKFLSLRLGLIGKISPWYVRVRVVLLLISSKLEVVFFLFWFLIF